MTNAPDLSEARLQSDYQQHRLAERVQYIPWILGSFLIISGLFIFSDLYLRHMPLFSLVRAVPCLLAVGLLVAWQRKTPPSQLLLWQKIWGISYICMFYGFVLISYKTPVYQSTLVALMIGVFTLMLSGILSLRELILHYALPFAVFFGLVSWLGLADARLAELGNVVALMAICTVLYSVRERYSFNNYRLTRQLEEAMARMKATQAQLIQKEKMASLGEMVTGIAHEIQNPLNFVNNFANLSVDLLTDLSADVTADNKAEALDLIGCLNANLNKITHHGNRAADIVRGMLQHAGGLAGDRQPTNLNALAAEYLQLAHRGLAARGIPVEARLNTDFDPATGLIDLTPQEIARVLLNVYNNAFYALHQKLNSLPADQQGTYQPELSVSTRREAGQVALRIRDNGTGIQPELLTKIYQPFYTTKPAGQGIGLGLSLSYDIITNSHGGELDVHTEVGQFTEFIIRLPATSIQFAHNLVNA